MEQDLYRSVAEIALAGERRQFERIYQTFPARVRGVAKTGETFSIDATVNNISAGGLFLQMPLEVDAGPQIRAVVVLKNPDTGSLNPPRLLVKGQVLRAGRLPDGRFGVAVELKNYRFL